MIRLVLVEDEQLTRDALVSLLDLEPDLRVVGEAADGRSGLVEVRAHDPDVVLLDLEMPGGDGVSVVQRLRTEGFSARCVIVTRHARPGVLLRALAAGVSGLVSKSVSAAELAVVIRRVHRGERVVDQELALETLGMENSPLTVREREVLRLVGPGKTAGDMARALHLSPGTVRNYLSTAMHKLGVRTRAEAVDHARDRGWI